jgi:hypothetical protein
MSAKTAPLKALAKYYDIKHGKKQIEIRCKVCRKGWGLEPEKADNFNPLGLFNHAFMHEDADKPVEECIE